MPSPEFEQRLNDYLDCDLDGSGRQALQHEVEHDPAARAAFEEALRIESLLAAAHCPEAIEERILHGLERRLEEDKVVRGVAFRSWPAMAAAAAAVVLAAVAMWHWRPAPPRAAPHQVLAGAVQVNGQIVQRLADGTELLVVGNELAKVKLSDGSLLEFDPGSVATIQGPQAHFRQVIALASGAGRFRVERGVHQFRVTTLLGVVTVLGTEFSVALRPADEFEAMHNNETNNQEMKLQTKSIVALAVAVTFGQVQVDIGGKTYTLSAGQTAYAKEGDKQGERKVWREMTGELTKLDGQSITVTVRKDSGARDESFQLTDATKVALETAEMETVPAEKGTKTRPKMADGKVGDLKTGQRVLVKSDAGVAMRIVVLNVRAPAKGKEGEREKDRRSEVKPRDGREGALERGGPSGETKPRKEGSEGDRR